MKIIPITDLYTPELEIYNERREVQLLHYYEPAPGLFIAESANVILRALTAGYEPLSILMEQREADSEKGREVLGRIMEISEEIPAYVSSNEVLSQISGFKLARGMLCAMRRRALTAGCSDPLYRRAARVSMGTVFQVPWTFLGTEDWANRTMEQLRGMGYRTAAMALKEDSLSPDARVLHEAEKLAIILGTEGEGLAADTIADCDYTVCIPMARGVDSLNVAAASAVAFWELCR